MGQIRAELLLSREVDDFDGENLMNLPSDEEITDALLPYYDVGESIFLIYSIDYADDNLGYTYIAADKKIKDPEDIMAIINFIDFIKNEVPTEKLLQTLWYFTENSATRMEFPTSQFMSAYSSIASIQDFIGQEVINDLTTIIDHGEIKTIVLNEYDFLNFTLGLWSLEDRQNQQMSDLPDEVAEEIFTFFPDDVYANTFAPIIEKELVDKMINDLLKYYDLSVLPEEISQRIDRLENIEDLDETIDYIRNLRNEMSYDGIDDTEPYDILDSLDEDLSAAYDKIDDSIYGRVSETLELLIGLDISIPELLGTNGDTLGEFIEIYLTAEDVYRSVLDDYTYRYNQSFEESFLDGFVNCGLLDRAFSYDHQIKNLQIVDDNVLIATLEEY